MARHSFPNDCPNASLYKLLKSVTACFYLLRFNCSAASSMNNSSRLTLQIDANRTIQVAVTLWRNGRGTIWIRLHPECLLVNRLHGVAQLVFEMGKEGEGGGGNEIILGPSKTVAVSLTAEVRD